MDWGQHQNIQMESLTVLSAVLGPLVQDRTGGVTCVPCTPILSPHSVPGTVEQLLSPSPCWSCTRCLQPLPAAQLVTGSVSTSSPVPGGRMGSELHSVVKMSKLEVAGRGLVAPLQGTARSHLCGQITILGCHCSLCCGLGRG